MHNYQKTASRQEITNKLSRAVEF